MGNANGTEGGSGIGRDDEDPLSGRRSNGESGFGYNHAPNSHPAGRVPSSDSMGNNTPPQSPRRSRSPVLFAPQEQLPTFLQPEIGLDIYMKIICTAKTGVYKGTKAESRSFTL